MKPKFLLLFLFLSFIAKAQTNELLEEIKETKNNKLIEFIEKQEPVFNELESYLKEIAKEEFNAKYDSINSLKFDKLMRFYIQIELNSRGLYKISKSRKQLILLSDYLETRLENVDKLYAAFISKRFEEKEILEKTDILQFNETPLDSIIEIRPVYEPCKENADVDLCTVDYIRKKVANSLYPPEIREIGNIKLKTIAQIIINKSGHIAFATIKESCGYFEYDMELIRVFNKVFINDKFIPAQQNGKIVKCRYALPVTFQIEY